jgi:hypothetical protein
VKPQIKVLPFLVHTQRIGFAANKLEVNVFPLLKESYLRQCENKTLGWKILTQFKQDY